MPVQLQYLDEKTTDWRLAGKKFDVLGPDFVQSENGRLQITLLN